MKTNSNERQENLIKKNFKIYFKKELLPSLEELDKKRKKYIIYIIGLALLFVLITYLIISWMASLECYIDNYAQVIAFFFIPAIFLSPIITAIFLYRKYKTISKNLVFQKLLNFLGDFQVETDNFVNRDYIKSLKLFDRYDTFRCDDRLTGTYKSLPLDIQEIALQIEIKGRGPVNSYIDVFRGIFVKIPCYKNFNGYTIIKNKSSIIDKILSFLYIGPSVSIEDTLFAKYYSISSDENIDSRYLLTPSFMERMIKIAKQKNNNKVSISFEQGNINIAIHSKKNWFEIPFLKSATNIKHYKNILYEITTIIKIIEALKIEQNIGL